MNKKSSKNSKKTLDKNKKNAHKLSNTDKNQHQDSDLHANFKSKTQEKSDLSDNSNLFQANLSMQDKLKIVEKYFLETYKTWLLIFVPFFVILSGLWTWNYLQDSKNQNLRQQLSAIDDLRLEIEKESQKIYNAYQEEYLATDSDDEDQDETKKALSQKKRDEILQKIKDYQPDFSSVIAKYIEFYEKNSKFTTGATSAIKAVSLLHKQKEYQKAHELIKKIYLSPPNTRFFQVQGRILYAELLERMEKYKEALIQIDKILSVDDLNKKTESLILFNKFRIADVSKNFQVRSETISELLSKHPTSNYTKSAIVAKILTNKTSNNDNLKINLDNINPDNKIDPFIEFKQSDEIQSDKTQKDQENSDPSD